MGWRGTVIPVRYELRPKKPNDVNISHFTRRAGSEAFKKGEPETDLRIKI